MCNLIWDHPHREPNTGHGLYTLPYFHGQSHNKLNVSFLARKSHYFRPIPSASSENMQPMRGRKV